MTKPPKTNVQVKIGQIRRLLAETRFETEVLMQKRIADIREDNRQLLLQIDGMALIFLLKDRKPKADT